MLDRLFLLASVLAVGGALNAVLAQLPAATRPQELVYALGLQSKSGSRVLTVGDVLHCQPFVEQSEVFRKTPSGEFESASESQEFLNCGSPAPGEPDRILAIVGIQWR